jgi:hypothetical protein
VRNFYLTKLLAYLTVISKFSLNQFLIISAIILEFILLWFALVALPQQECSSGFILISLIPNMLGVAYILHGQLEYLYVITNFDLLLFITSILYFVEYENQLFLISTLILY